MMDRRVGLRLGLGQGSRQQRGGVPSGHFEGVDGEESISATLSCPPRILSEKCV